jgi:predicted phosphodiesterase
MAKDYPDTDVLVFGHSHIPWDTTAKTGLRLLNPGSPTDRRSQPFCTYMTATVDAALSDVVLHRVDRHA